MPFDIDIHDTEPPAPTVDRLLDVARKLGDDEQSVLLLIAERLALGRQAYGELRIDEDPRDWVYGECLSEFADAAVYAACGIIRQRRNGEPRRLVGKERAG